jgi:hypothetical protein
MTCIFTYVGSFTSGAFPPNDRTSALAPTNQTTTSHRRCSRAGLERHDGKADDDEDSPRVQPPANIRTLAMHLLQLTMHISTNDLLLAVIRLDGTTRRASHESLGKVLVMRLSRWICVW